MALRLQLLELPGHPLHVVEDDHVCNELVVLDDLPLLVPQVLRDDVPAEHQPFREFIELRTLVCRSVHREAPLRVVDAAFAKACLQAFFQVGDQFLADPRNALHQFFSIRSEIQAYWLVHHLVEILPGDEREPVIVERIREGGAVVLACQMAWSIERMHKPDAEERDSVFQQFAPETVEQLPSIAVAR